MKLSLEVWRHAFNRVRTGGLALMVIGVQGCVVVPVPQLPSDHVTLIEKKEIELIQAEKTRREDIYRQLGPPKHNYGDGSRWIYDVESHRAGGFRVCGAIINPIPVLEDSSPPTGTAGCTDKKKGRKATLLDIKFNGSGIVENRQFITMKNGKCAKEKDCIDLNTSTFVYASSDHDRVAKQFVPELNQCAVYLYMSKAPSMIYIQIDELLPRTRFRSETTFLRFDLDAGVRNITFFDKARFSWREIGESPGSLGQLTDAIELDCSNGNVFLIQGQIDEKNNLVITLMPDAEGHQEISKRNLILIQDTVSWQPGN